MSSSDFGIRYEWTPYLKPLTIHFQNVHLQCKNNRLLEYTSPADIYIEREREREKDRERQRDRETEIDR